MVQLPDDLDPLTRRRVEAVLSRAPPAGDELLDDGQEEVFSRTEVESAASDHQSGGGAPQDGHGLA
jgi:hypothetical protein